LGHGRLEWLKYAAGFLLEAFGREAGGYNRLPSGQRFPGRRPLVAFPESVVREAFNKVSGRCRCTRKNHHHFFSSCAKQLDWNERGKETPTGWEAHHIMAEYVGGKDILSNCEILCIECHKITRSYGG
jgi:5-methylcytosine-specific restriction endonuclease McrA